MSSTHDGPERREAEPTFQRAAEPVEPVRRTPDQSPPRPRWLADHAIQRAATDPSEGSPGRIAPGVSLPTGLRSGIESLSGYSMADVEVHYDSPKPERVGALAYTEGTHIHLAPGQGSQLPHEAWHVVQQKQGRVRPTTAVNGTPVNDDAALEAEADQMGAQLAAGTAPASDPSKPLESASVSSPTPQLAADEALTDEVNGR